MCSCSGSCNCNSTTIPRGPQGLPGQQGPIGPQGLPGNAGATGPAGPTIPGGKIISDVSSGIVNSPAQVNLLMRFTDADGPSLEQWTFEFDIFVTSSDDGSTVVITNTDTAAVVFTIALPTLGAGPTRSYAIKIFITKNSGTTFSGIYTVTSTGLTTTTFTSTPVALTGISFAADQTYQITFDPVSVGNSIDYALVRFYNGSQEF